MENPSHLENLTHTEYWPVTYYYRPQFWSRVYLPFMDIMVMLTNLLGVLFNIPVIMIFYKDDLTSNSNVCFFSLAITDLCYSAVVSMYRLITNFFWDLYDLLRYTLNLSYCVNAISAWITFLITLERVICIISPLKVS